MAKRVADCDDGRRNKKPMAEPAMPEQEAIRLATEAIRSGRAKITGEAWATYVDGEEWQLDKLGMPGNYWYVHFALAEVPGWIEPGEVTTLAVNCETGEVTIPP